MLKLQKTTDVLCMRGCDNVRTWAIGSLVNAFGVVRWVCGRSKVDLLEDFDLPHHANGTICMSMLLDKGMLG